MQNKTSIIIAAGSGMGAAAARKLAADGYHVGLLSSSGKAEALAQELGGVGVTGSNQNQADIQKLVDLVMERWGPCRCAGQLRRQRPACASAGIDRCRLACRH